MDTDRTNQLSDAATMLQALVDKALQTGGALSCGLLVINNAGAIAESEQAQGDAVFSCFSAAVSSTIKDQDVFVRVSEDTFGVFLYGCRINIANVRLSQIRDRFKKASMAETGINFFVSHGVAELSELAPNEQNAAALLERASSRLKFTRPHAAPGKGNR